MKKLCSLLILMSSLKFSGAQLVWAPKNKLANTIGEIKSKGSTIAIMSYEVKNSDTIYTIMDSRRRRGVSYGVSFPGNNGMLDKVYAAIQQVFAKDQIPSVASKTVYRFGNDFLVVADASTKRRKLVRIDFQLSGVQLSEEDAAILFGKKQQKLIQTKIKRST